MTGFLMTIAMLTGVLVTMPYWDYSRTWGFKPFGIFSFLSVIVGALWIMEKI